MKLKPELGTFEWWISGLMLDPIFFLFSKLNNACSSLVVNLQINNRSELRIFHSKVFSSESELLNLRIFHLYDMPCADLRMNQFLFNFL